MTSFNNVDFPRIFLKQLEIKQHKVRALCSTIWYQSLIAVELIYVITMGIKHLNLWGAGKLEAYVS